jgi:2-desacetyl-2-hydroxyethyl bacteriochlorophyllide A dehydrogenase
MKYIVCEKPGTFLLKEKPAPVKVQGEALLKIRKVGICGTDLHAYAGRQPFFTYPRILGHELAAEITDIEPGIGDLIIGDMVVVMPYVGCKKCYACRNGKTNCCADIKVLGVHTDGGMQEQISVPADLLLPARGLGDREIAIVEPLAIGMHAIRRAQLRKGETVVVVGCGPIGMGIMSIAKLMGASVIAIDTNQSRLNYAREKFGIANIVPSGNGAEEAVQKITGGDMAAVVFDATGNRKALESGIDLMAHGGRYVLVGLTKGPLEFIHPKIHAKETSLLCSRNATKEDFEGVIGILREGRFPLDAYITHEVKATEMIANFDGWADPSTGVMKALVSF